MTRRTTFGWLSGLAAAAALLAATHYDPPGRPAETPFETARIDRGPLVASVTATGTLSALVTVQVGTQVSGRIKELFVDFNSQVATGQVLATIDPQIFEAALAQARANHTAARGDLAMAAARVVEADRQLSRARSLAAKGLVAQAELDTAESNAAVAKAQVEAARGKVEQTRAALHQAGVNLDYTRIVSPIDGIVVARNVDVGQTVAASLQAPTLFLIAQDLRRMQVDTSVAESDIGKLRPGMPADFKVDAHPAERFKGMVRQIRNAPQTLQNVVTYDAVIDVDNPDLKLRPGMTANVTFVYAEKSDVLRIPNAALRFRPPPELLKQTGGLRDAKRGTREPEPPDRRTVWRLRGKELEPLSIRTGVTDGALTEVVGGPLAPGAEVIVDAPAVARGEDRQRMGGGSMRRLF